jgi:hypothetical protein
MRTRLWPKQADNAYGDPALAVWLLALFAVVKFIQGATSTFYTRFAMTGADAIPLDRFDATGASTATALFALLGLYIMLFALPTLAVVIRYRALVPLTYLFWIVEEVSKIAVLAINPIARSTATPSGAIVNRILLAVLVVGFVLSLVSRSRQTPSLPG